MITTFLVTVLFALLAHCYGCTSGFPTRSEIETHAATCDDGCFKERDMGNNDGYSTRIIPTLMFTCTGTLIKYTIAGEEIDDENRDPALQIWREISDQPDTYNRLAMIPVEISTCSSVGTSGRIYECTLSVTVAVNSGDILGIELPRQRDSRFRPYFISSSSQANYDVYNFGSISMHPSPQLGGSRQIGSTDNSLPLLHFDIVTATASTNNNMPPTTPLVPSDINSQFPTETTVVAETVRSTREDPVATDHEASLTTPTPALVTTATTPSSTHNVMETVTPGGTDSSTSDSGTAHTTTADPGLISPPIEQQQNSGKKNTETIAGATVGALIVVLLQIVLFVALVLLYIRRRNTKRKMPNHNTGASSPHLSNPTYEGIQLHETKHLEPQPVDVPYDYDDIELPVPNKCPIVIQNSARTDERNDYTRTPQPPYATGAYEDPVAIHSQLPPAGHYEWGAFVPSQEQRNQFFATEVYLQPLTSTGGVYEMHQYSNEGPTPSFFEECENFWEPSSTANELYQQLFTKKYREILRAQIQVTSELGAGQFGTVNKGIWQSPMGAMDVAVKTLHSGATEEERVKFLQEAAINGQFRHPNVVQLMGVVTVDEPVMIVLELVSNGDLRNYLIKQRPSPGEILPTNTPQLLLKFCQQVSSGMEYLARKGFVHRDLAARNILLTEDKICKISDFGMSRDLLDDNYYVSHGGKVPVKWTAPEAINYKKYSTSSDVWSFGCVMYEIWSIGHKPFESYSNQEVVKMVGKGYRLPPPPGCSKEMYKIMIQCWHPDRGQRPSFAQLVEMLSRPDFELLAWIEDEDQSNPLARVVGGSLDIAKNLYPELQNAYTRH